MRTKITLWIWGTAIVSGLSLGGCNEIAEQRALAERRSAELRRAQDEIRESLEVIPIQMDEDMLQMLADLQKDELREQGKTPEHAENGSIPPSEEDKSPGTSPKLDGKSLYLSKCKTCHGVNGKGKTKFAKKHDVADLTTTKLSVTEVHNTLRSGITDTKMKSFAKKFSDDELKAIATYVKNM